MATGILTLKKVLGTAVTMSLPAEQFFLVGVGSCVINNSGRRSL